MNRIMSEYYGLFEMYQALRGQMMDLLDDEDLAFQPGGDNATLGALCKEIGEVQHCYIDSFDTFTQDFTYRNEEPGLAQSVSRLEAWFGRLDEDLKARISGFSDEDLASRVIDRGGGFVLPPQIQLEVYKEALLIFYGKVDVYLKAMGKTLPEQWRHWIA